MGYIGGESTDFIGETSTPGDNTQWDAVKNFRGEYTEEHSASIGSLLAYLIPYTTKRNNIANPHDIRGEWNSNYVRGSRFEGSGDIGEETQFPSAQYYLNQWKNTLSNNMTGTNIFETNRDDRDVYFQTPYKHLNTVTYQGHQWNYNPKNCDHSSFIANTGRMCLLLALFVHLHSLKPTFIRLGQTRICRVP